VGAIKNVSMAVQAASTHQLMDPHHKQFCGLLQLLVYVIPLSNQNLRHLILCF